MNRTSTFACFALLALGATASAQTQTFTGGNPFDWGFEASPSTIQPAGGNPGAYLADTSIGPGAQFPNPRLWPRAANHPYRGDFRALGIANIGLDVQIFSGMSVNPGNIYLFLGSDNGTPGDFGDDCVASFDSGILATTPTAGWLSIDFAIDTVGAGPPSGWTVGGPTCTGTNLPDIWDFLITDVDYIAFMFGSTFMPGGGDWSVGIDNIRIGGSSIGTNFCQANPNSSGGPALMSAFGSASVALNNLRLVAAPTPAGQPGIFYYGPDEIGAPFGDGFRCVSGSAGTIFRLFPFSQTNANGEMSFIVDNTNPTHAPQLQQVGSTWKFQCWFRDPVAGLTGFNLSDGLSLTLEP